MQAATRSTLQTRRRFRSGLPTTCWAAMAAAPSWCGAAVDTLHSDLVAPALASARLWFPYHTGDYWSVVSTMRPSACSRSWTASCALYTSLSLAAHNRRFSISLRSPAASRRCRAMTRGTSSSRRPSTWASSGWCRARQRRSRSCPTPVRAHTLCTAFDKNFRLKRCVEPIRGPPCLSRQAAIGTAQVLQAACANCC